MSRIPRILLFMSCLVGFSSFAQNNPPGSWPAKFYAGWTKTLHGEGFGYHSPVPGVSTSMLVRSEDSTQYIGWETEALRNEGGTGDVTFAWLFGIDANPAGHRFRLFLNGVFCLEFANPVVTDKEPWTVKGRNGVTLTFRPTMIDKYDDPMGYAFLTIPRSLLRPGRPQSLKVCGESAGSRAWYMTFESRVEESITLEQLPALMRGPETGEMLCVMAEIVHLGEPVTATISGPASGIRRVTLLPGHNAFRIKIPAARTGSVESFTIAIEGKPVVERQLALKPVRPWKIYLVQHTHTDIGYTRPQTEILPEHLRYIDYALDYCDQTDTLPDDARFRWTCETSWAVKEYLASRPAGQAERLRRRVSEGRIELTALYLNSSDLSDEASVAASLKPVASFRGQGFPVKAAMQSDINGVPWCLAEYLGEAGIGYLNMGQNTDRARKPFDRPTTFRWESPSGKRILVNRPEHYMTGNMLGILTGVEALEKNLFPHLSGISAKGYPFEEYAIQFSGYLTDNSPPSTAACRTVREWNESYVWPKLRLATVSEFFDLVKEKHEQELPVIRGAWPDWWIDGFGSAALATAYARQTHADQVANNGLMAMSAMLGIAPAEQLTRLQEQVTDDLLFFDEHTFGAAESITDPLCENSVVQLGEKLSYAWDAVKKCRILREKSMGRIQHLFHARPDQATLTLLNTMPRERRALADVYMDRQVLPPDRKFRIIGADGREMPVQALSGRAEGGYFTLMADRLPSFGYRTWRIEVSADPVEPLKSPAFTGVLENRWYRLHIDPATGRIMSLFDKEAGRELAGIGAEYGFGEFIYETLGKDREQIPKGYLQNYRRDRWERVSVSGTAEGPVWSSVTLTGHMPGCVTAEGITCEIRLYKGLKQVEFRFAMKKLPVTDPEGVYIAFPFAMSREAHVFYEAAGATVEAGREQIDGSATDWQGVQNFILVEDGGFGVTFVSPEIPIMQLGGLNLGKFAPAGEKPLPVIYSWVLNNYWTTNFLASQEGELRWSYAMTSGGNVTRESSADFAMSRRIPVLARVLPASPRTVVSRQELSLLEAFPGNLLMVDASPTDDGTGIRLQIRETAGKDTRVDPAGWFRSGGPAAFSRVERINVLGETIGQVVGGMTIKGLETVFLRIMAP